MVLPRQKVPRAATAFGPQEFYRELTCAALLDVSALRPGALNTVLH